jgi:hypothetical protein
VASPTYWTSAPAAAGPATPPTPALATDPREIVLCYPRHRQMTATALALITAIRAQAAT